jgi:hypothetical protein
MATRVRRPMRGSAWFLSIVVIVHRLPGGGQLARLPLNRLCPALGHEATFRARRRTSGSPSKADIRAE